MSIEPLSPVIFLFFFNDTATTEIYTLSLHDALPIWEEIQHCIDRAKGDIALVGDAVIKEAAAVVQRVKAAANVRAMRNRSEEHTSELQSQSNLVCRLLLEKKKKQE